VSSGYSLQVDMRPLIGTQIVSCSPTRISGTDKDGVYRATVTLPRGAKEGVWEVTSLLIPDKVNNYVQLDAAALEAKFGAGSAQVTNLATVSDTTPPQITAFSLMPATVNTESADQTVTVTMTLTDDQAGVASSGDMTSGYALQVELRPLIGTQIVLCSPTRISGTDKDGVYQGTVTLPRGAKEGVWQVSSMSIPDKVNNYVQLDAAALAAALPGADVLVANTAQAQQVTIDRDWRISTAKTSVTFPAGTVVTRADDARFAFYQMAAQEFTIDASVPATGLAGEPLAGLRIGIPGLNLSFSQPVTIAITVGSEYDGYTLDIKSLTEGGVAWANETSAPVADGVCRFTVNHATRFVASVTTVPMTVQPGAHGTISPGSGVVSYGSNATYAITPDAGYGVASLTVDGVARTPASSWTFTNVTVRHSIAATFTQSKPRIAKLSPKSGRRGCTVTISGTGFGAKKGKVKFGRVACTKIVSWSASRIKCKVPARAKSGKVKVTVTASGSVSNSLTFRVKP
jgi:hypothetical protein